MASWKYCVTYPCPHGKLKGFCVDCNGCPHGKLKRNCADCNPCPHGKLKRHLRRLQPVPAWQAEKQLRGLHGVRTDAQIQVRGMQSGSRWSAGSASEAQTREIKPKIKQEPEIKLRTRDQAGAVHHPRLFRIRD